MARVYDIAVAALAVDVDRKWLDNLTSQHSIPGTEHLTRGVARRLTLRALVIAAIVRDLNRFLAVPVARAVALSTQMVVLADRSRMIADGAAGDASQRDEPSVIDVGGAIALRVDIGRIERDIEARLLEAMETVVPRRRGRPPRKERRGTR